MQPSALLEMRVWMSRVSMTLLLTEVCCLSRTAVAAASQVSPPGKDWVRRAVGDNCIKARQITAATHCFRKTGNKRLIPLHLPDCHVGEYIDSNNPILQPSPNLVGLRGNQFKFYKRTALPVGRQQLPAHCTESRSLPRKEVNVCPATALTCGST